jgi:hypothetical protein
MSRPIQLLEADLINIQQLYCQGKGISKICRELNLSRYYVIVAYRQLKLTPVSKGGGKKPQPLPTNKTCKVCHTNKSIDQFRIKRKNHLVHYDSYCIECDKMLKKEHYHKNMTAELRKKYKNNRKDKNREYLSSRMKSDIVYRMRKLISHAIRRQLKKNNSRKNNSIIKVLPFSMEELKKHLESQFEPWMNWDNHGSYQQHSWKDDDSSTWTWQIDHIIPQSDLPYATMEEENFHKSWALNNLRPLSAKQNLLDGARKIRHKII